MMLERGLKVDHSTIGRWVLTYSPHVNLGYKTQQRKNITRIGIVP